MVAVKGYFKDTNFINDDNTPIPEGQPDQYTESQKHKKTWGEFFKAMDEIDDEPLAETFDEVIAEGMHFREIAI
ncbi:hypothetical protein FACS1894200_06290 [Spirochaetia bacterium]|nr:hypothetical protein FACS1894200_06270 [Spirochaetia bacterium]GHU48700.1 hypothetical protein FACS1894200_06290 [Spirochaetia bacterium]